MQNATSNFYQQHIPWWSDISPAVMAELELPISVPPSQTVDVIVLGGGVAGLSAALSARSAGAQVLLLEREAVLGYGATGRNAGILSAGINMGIADLPPDSSYRAFWPETTHLLRALVAEATQPGSLLSAHLTGSLSLAETKNAARKLAREARSRQEAGLQAHLWTPAQVTAATQGRLNVQSVINALWLPDEGRIQPLTLLAHLAQQARASGVLIAGRADVVHYRETTAKNSKHHWQLTLADGSLIRNSWTDQCSWTYYATERSYIRSRLRSGLSRYFPSLLGCLTLYLC